MNRTEADIVEVNGDIGKLEQLSFATEYLFKEYIQAETNAYALLKWYLI